MSATNQVTKANGKRPRGASGDDDVISKRLRSSKSSTKHSDLDMSDFVVADNASDDDDWSPKERKEKEQKSGKNSSAAPKSTTSASSSQGPATPSALSVPKPFLVPSALAGTQPAASSATGATKAALGTQTSFGLNFGSKTTGDSKRSTASATLLSDSTKAPLKAAALTLPTVKSVSLDARFIAHGTKLGGAAVLLLEEQGRGVTYLVVERELTTAKWFIATHELRPGQLVRISDVLPELDSRLVAFDTHPYNAFEKTMVTPLEEKSDAPAVSLTQLFCPLEQLTSTHAGNSVCVRGYTGHVNGIEIENKEGDGFLQWRLPVCSGGVAISASSRQPVPVTFGQPICVFGAILHSYNSKTGNSALVLNLGKPSFWIAGRSNLLTPEITTWWNERPKLAHQRQLHDLSGTSFGVDWDANTATARCDMGELGALINDDCTRVRLEEPVEVELKQLLGGKNFCYASCAVPNCRAKVSEGHSETHDDVTFLRCAAKRPHRCLTYTWRYMTQGQFLVRNDKTGRPCTLWLRNDAVAAIFGATGDEFSILTPQEQLDLATTKRSGGRFLATIICERPTGDFNKGRPVLYCSRLDPCTN